MSEILDTAHMHKVIVFVDKEEHSMTALRLAAARTKIVKNAKLQIITVVDAGVNNPLAPSGASPLEQKQAEELIAKCVEIAREIPDLVVEGSIEYGVVADEIARIAATGSVILVIVGAPASDNKNSALYSIVAKLSAGMAVPLLIVPGNTTMQQISTLCGSKEN